MLKLSHLALMLCMSLSAIAGQAAAAERVAVGRFTDGTLNLYEPRFLTRFADGATVEEISVSDESGAYLLTRKGRGADGGCKRERVALADASGKPLHAGAVIDQTEAFVFDHFEVFKLDCLDSGICGELIGGVTPNGRLIVDARCAEVGPNDVCRCRVTFPNGDTTIAPPPASGMRRCTEFSILDWMDLHDWFQASAIETVPL